MAVLTFLHPRATVSEAVEAVKADLLKSLSARSDMHCDSLVGEEVSGAGDEVRPFKVFSKSQDLLRISHLFKAATALVDLFLLTLHLLHVKLM